ncbi:MAG: enoyl-CoA hydratase-related protein [Cytophagales bacterium]|nr:enoyl-CoA hydratase-related protein [Cytophagales bacterium]
MEEVMYEVKQRMALITLCRSEKRNAFSFSMVDKLCRTLRDIQNEPKAKLAIIKAEGNVFSAGADLKELQEMQEETFEENIANANRWTDLFQMLNSFPKMVIAQVEGPAMGGGCGLVSACDFAFATSRAVFSCPEVKIGFIPSIVMFFLVQRVGEAWAKEIMLAAEPLSARRAFEIGLINAVVDGDIFEHTKDFAQRLIKGNSSQSMETTKHMISRIQNMPVEDALRYAAEMNANARISEECREGVSSFMEDGEPPDWTHK